MATKRRTGKLDRFNGPPSGDFQVNQDLAKSLGLVAWYPAAGSRGGFLMKDYVGNCHAPMPTIQTPTWTYDKDHGVEFNLADSSTTLRTPKSSYTPLYLRPFSIFSWFRTYSTPILGCYFSTYDGVTDDNSIWLGSSPTGMLTFRTRSTSNNTIEDTVAMSNSTVYFAVGTNKHMDQRLYKNGVLAGTPGTGTQEISNTGLGVGILRGQYDGEGSFFEGGFCNRVLSPAEITELYNNRWDLYEPMHPTFYSIPGTVQPVKRTRHSINGGWPY